MLVPMASRRIVEAASRRGLGATRKVTQRLDKISNNTRAKKNLVRRHVDARNYSPPVTREQMSRMHNICALAFARMYVS
jgi:hypothetical protein